MSESEVPFTPEGRLRTMRIIWGALVVSVLLYGVVLHVTHHTQVESTRTDMTLVFAIGMVAVTTAVMSFVIPQMGYRQGVRAAAERLKVNDAVSVSTGEQWGFRQAAPSNKVFENGPAALRAAFGVFQTPFILGLALSESVAIDGFLLAYLGYGVLIAAPFFVVSLALMALRFPRREAIVARFEAETGARIPAV